MDYHITQGGMAQAEDHYGGQSTEYEEQDVGFDENSNYPCFDFLCPYAKGGIVIDPVLRGIYTEPSCTGSPDYDYWIRGGSNEPPEDEKGPEGHVEEVGAANTPTPQDDQIYLQTQSYAIDQTRPHSPQYPNSDHSAGCPELTGVCQLTPRAPLPISSDPRAQDLNYRANLLQWKPRKKYRYLRMIE
jgi:hypothetical protein